jgi:hypothetical protein
MRKVVAYELLSLDGVAEKPEGFFADSTSPSGYLLVRYRVTE